MNSTIVVDLSEPTTRQTVQDLKILVIERSQEGSCQTSHFARAPEDVENARSQVESNGITQSAAWRIHSLAEAAAKSLGNHKWPVNKTLQMLDTVHDTRDVGDLGQLHGEELREVMGPLTRTETEASPVLDAADRARRDIESLAELHDYKVSLTRRIIKVASTAKNMHDSSKRLLDFIPTNAVALGLMQHIRSLLESIHTASGEVYRESGKAMPQAVGMLAACERLVGEGHDLDTLWKDLGECMGRASASMSRLSDAQTMLQRNSQEYHRGWSGLVDIFPENQKKVRANTLGAMLDDQCLHWQREFRNGLAPALYTAAEMFVNTVTSQIEVETVESKSGLGSDGE